MPDYELSPEQEQYIREQNEKSRVAREDREARRLQRADLLEQRQGDYAVLRGQMAGVNQRLSDLNGKYNAMRVEIGEIGQAKIDAAGVIRKDTIAIARQEYLDTRQSESEKYQAVFTAATGQMRQDTDAVAEEFDEELDEIRRERRGIVDQIRNFAWG